MLFQICKNFSQELIQQRLILGLSQQQLANLAGVSRKSLQKYEATQHKTASLEVLMRIAKAMEDYRENLIDD